MVLLKKSISIPKLLYVLRTSNCYNHPHLLNFNAVLKKGLSSILNVDFDETQWTQSTLPVSDGGLGIWCANTLATSAFLAFAASTHTLQQSILPSSYNPVIYRDQVSVEATWRLLSSVDIPEPLVQRFQKAWDSPIVKKLSQTIYASMTSDVDKARLYAAHSPHSGDWLQAPPIASVGFCCQTRRFGSQWHTDSALELVRLTHVRAAKQLMPEDCMAYLARDRRHAISVTP